MIIERYQHHSPDELKERLRHVRLRGTGTSSQSAFVYRNADIRLVDNVAPQALIPAQYYRLEKAMTQVAETRAALRERHIDMFHLNGYIVYWIKGEANPYTLLPPIIEYDTTPEGEAIPLIVDGVHRVSLAIKEGIHGIQIVEVLNVPIECPYYGYANPNGWADVIDRADPPVPEEKRLWRKPIEEAYSLYRDFNTAFGEVGQPRTSSISGS